MALKQNYELVITYRMMRDGHNLDNVPAHKIETTIISNAYMIVGKVNGDKEKIKFKVYVYRDNTKNELLTIETHSFIPSVENDSDNFIKQAYEYLKTLPQFADAVDC